VSFVVHPGEVVGLIGPNGAGKTTLFDVISGVRAPRRGHIRLAGQDVTGLSPTGRARAGLRRTFQTVQVFGWLSVVDNVVAALDHEGGGGGLFADLVASPTRRRREAARRVRALDALDRCGLASLASSPAGLLPIGYARMLEVARALVQTPKVLLLDEPTSGLDPEEAARLARVIRSLAAEGCAVVLVEHDIEFVMAESTRLIVLNLGEVIASGTPAEIRENQLVRSAYLG
jgi:branched-chain amino acid transport system ATP-binding protein